MGLIDIFQLSEIFKTIASLLLNLLKKFRLLAKKDPTHPALIGLTYFVKCFFIYVNILSRMKNL